MFHLSADRTPNGIRTRAVAVKGRCPRPLDDGGLAAWPKGLGSDLNKLTGI